MKTTDITGLAGNDRMRACLAAARDAGFTEPGYAGNYAHTSGRAQIEVTDGEASVRVHLFDNRGRYARHPIATGYVDVSCVEPSLFAAILDAVVEDITDVLDDETAERIAGRGSEYGPQF